MTEHARNRPESVSNGVSGRKRPKRRSKSLKAVADLTFARWIIARDQWCQRCGSTDWLQCAHVHSRRYDIIRHDKRNAMALCRGCHFWQTTHPLEGEEFFISKIGADTFYELRKMALAGGKPDYKAIIADLAA